MARPFYIEHATSFNGGITVLGAIIFAMGILDFTVTDVLNIGDWGFYFIGIGFVLLLAGLLLVYAYVKRVRSFNKLMLCKSKKEFASIRDDLEYTAWRLPSKFDAKVAEKKKELDVK